MGLQFYVGEVQGKINDAVRMNNEGKQAIAELQSSISQFLSAPLSGKAYASAKTYFQVAYTPLCRAAIMSGEALVSAHKRLLSEYQSTVGSIDNVEDELLDQINQLESLKSDLSRQMSEAKTMRPDLEKRYINACDSITKRRERIQKLTDYSTISESFFQEYETCQQQYIKGLAQVQNSKAWNAASGTFDLDLLDMSWATAINERWAQREAENMTYEIEVRMDEFGNPIYEVYRNGRLDYDLTVEYINLMATLRLQQLDDVLNSPGGKLYTAIVSTVLMFNGTKIMIQGLYELGKGLSIAYGVDAATGQMVPLLVQTDGLTITNVVTSISDGLAQTLTGVAISKFASSGNLSSGDTTRGGRVLTDHAAENANNRGFSLDKIDDIIENYSQKVYQSEGKTVFAKKNGNWYDVIITNKNNDIITVVGGNTHSLKTWKDVIKMLNNNGGYSSLPY